MPATFEFISAGVAHAGKLVTGAPYTAEGVTDFTQTLSDGTRISRRSTSRVARDSQGRTREERTMPVIGPWSAAGDAPRLVTITDPVAKEVYILNEKEKTTVKHELPSGGVTAAIHASADVVMEKPIPVPPGAAIEKRVMMFRHASGANEKEESLGRQVFEGITAEGKRTAHTIAAGEIGNDRPIVTSVERWTSPELQVLVRSLTKDPMTGEISYRLANISRTEPPKTLFQIPPDYTVRTQGPIKIKDRVKSRE
jgi:hypothetical protein